MLYSRLIGTGSYLPKNILTNLDLAHRVNTTDQWIRDRTGIIERRIASENESSVSMGTNAAWRALEYANLDVEDIELIVVATSTPDRIFPSTACLIQDALGINGKCAAFDVNAACAGFNYALSVADQFLKTGFAKTALVIGTEVMSRIIDWTDRTTCVLFADGAGAVLLQAGDTPGIYSTHLHADGQYKDLLYTPGHLPIHGKRESCHLKMRGNEVFKIAVNYLGNLVVKTIENNGFSSNELDWIVPHQANLRIIQAVAKRLNLPMEKVVITVERHGNTSAASIPLALDYGIRDGRILPGHLILLEGFGGGFTWGSALIRF